jgi:hypothetical protein
MTEEIAEIIRIADERSCPGDCREHNPCLACKQADDVADQIMAIVNKPITRQVTCEKCGGTGEICTNPDNPHPILSYAPCTCDNGKREAVVMLRVPAEHEGATGYDKPLTAPDLRDPDIAWAYWAINTKWNHKLLKGTMDIPNGKMVLRLEVKDGE